jgi:hypothetical protein
MAKKYIFFFCLDQQQTYTKVTTKFNILTKTYSIMSYVCQSSHHTQHTIYNKYW